MTDTTISDAVVWPQDEGTGLPSPNRDYADIDSAGYLSRISEYAGGTYVGEGLGFTVDTTNEAVTVGSGFAFLTNSGTDVQSGSQNTYDTTLPYATPFVVILPTSTASLGLGTDTDNDVYLAFDPTANDSVYIRHGSAVSAPSDPYIKLGTANTSDGSTTRPNENANPVYDSLDVVGGNVNISSGKLEVGDRVTSLYNSDNSKETVMRHDGADAVLSTNWGGLRFNSGDGTRVLELINGGNVEIPNGRLLVDGTDDSPLKAQTATNKNAALPTDQTWAGEIHNTKDSQYAGGLIVSNRWANSDTDILRVGNSYDDGDGFDRFFTVDGGGNVEIPNGSLQTDVITPSSAATIKLRNSGDTLKIGSSKITAREKLVWGSNQATFIDLYTDTGANTAINLPVTSSPTAGTEESYSFDIDGTTLLKAYAEADGAGGIQNKKVEVPNGDLNVTGFVGSGDNIYLQAAGNIRTFSGNAQLRTAGGGSDYWAVKDTFNSQNIALFNEGGNVQIPNGDLQLGSGGTGLDWADRSGDGSTWKDAVLGDGTRVMRYGGVSRLSLASGGNVTVDNGDLDISGNQLFDKNSQAGSDFIVGDPPSPSSPTSGINSNTSPQIRLTGKQTDSSGNSGFVSTRLSAVPDTNALNDGKLAIDVEGTRGLNVYHSGNVEVPNGELSVQGRYEPQRQVESGNIELASTDSPYVFHRQHVPSGKTLYIYEMGLQDESNTAPSGITVEAYDETNAVSLASYNTKFTEGTALASKSGAIDVAFQLDNSSASTNGYSGFVVFALV